MVKMIENKGDLQDANQNLITSGTVVKILDCQVAGHLNKKGKPYAFLSHKDGYVLKPVFMDEEQGRREFEFYEELKHSCDPLVKELKNFVPQYFGTTHLNLNKDDMKWLILKDITHGFKEPCVMDIKVGAQTWDPFATEEKIRSEKEKYRQCKRDLGFCIPGFQVYNVSTGELLKRDREFGKSLNGTTAKNAIKTFLNGENGWSRSLLLQFLAKLWKILRWFRTQTKYNFFSSSLLLVYDAAKLKELYKRDLYRSKNKVQKATIARQLSLRIPTGPLTPGFSDGLSNPNVRGETVKSSDRCPAHENWEVMLDNVCKTHSLVNNYERDLETIKENYKVVLQDLMGRSSEQYEIWVNVSMIDFAHSYHSKVESTDKNYLDGLQSLVNVFEEFLMEADLQKNVL